jgi:hypothetical protein
MYTVFTLQHVSVIYGHHLINHFKVNTLITRLLFPCIGHCLQFLGEMSYVSFLLLMPAVVHIQA